MNLCEDSTITQTHQVLFCKGGREWRNTRVSSALSRIAYAMKINHADATLSKYNQKHTEAAASKAVHTQPKGCSRQSTETHKENAGTPTSFSSKERKNI